MNAFFLVIPIILLRYGLLIFISKGAFERAAYFPPLIGKERAALWVYQITIVCMFFYSFLLEIRTGSYWFVAGLITYGLGTLLYAKSLIDYAHPMNGINTNGLYRVSRNPMYVAFFIYCLGIAFLTRSLILLVLLIVHQISVHWIILSEERWCIKEFGQEYVRYMSKVRRYI